MESGILTRTAKNSELEPGITSQPPCVNKNPKLRCQDVSCSSSPEMTVKPLGLQNEKPHLKQWSPGSATDQSPLTPRRDNLVDMTCHHTKNCNTRAIILDWYSCTESPRPNCLTSPGLSFLIIKYYSALLIYMWSERDLEERPIKSTG